ncbi:helix-turn-helix domain-containing protein [Alicyclobacillus sp. ALC3]|uniref:helix-turn-helix domain-containing protein n=1 Tax=Alicyclobacillus sp. ALC3 TaxID=2796143 RepID=UPI00237A036B|nr:helix-turn-helix transcriptional regulator [Alicyclobacillus sp. ALC3]WDL95248.1 helix-turn-helix transcriptional regulator [Alicyclobacillus sp. ALC3]
MIGKRIQSLRRERQLSLSELSRRANVAKSYLSAIERDLQTNPSLQVIERISKVLNVSVQSLVAEDF